MAKSYSNLTLCQNPSPFDGKISEANKKWILLPAKTYKVLVPYPKDKELNFFQETILSLFKSGNKTVDYLSKKLLLKSELIEFIIKELEEKNVFIVNNNNASVEVIDTDTIRNIEHITHNEFSLVDATLMYSLNKDILLVEGTNDYNYILEAISKTKIAFNIFFSSPPSPCWIISLVVTPFSLNVSFHSLISSFISTIFDIFSIFFKSIVN